MPRPILSCSSKLSTHPGCSHPASWSPLLCQSLIGPADASQAECLLQAGVICVVVCQRRWNQGGGEWAQVSLQNESSVFRVKMHGKNHEKRLFQLSRGAGLALPCFGIGFWHQKIEMESFWYLRNGFFHSLGAVCLLRWKSSKNFSFPVIQEKLVTAWWPHSLSHLCALAMLLPSPIQESSWI